MSEPRPSDGGGEVASSREARLAEVFQHYLDRLAAGERLDKSQLRRAHPDLADELLDDLETLEGLGSEPAARPGGRVGSFRIVREVGRGGMGIVYEGWDEAMERQVALKVLPANLLGNPRAVARFVKEAKIAGRLRHPGIVPVYGMGIDSGGPFYAMEYVEGRTLARALADSRPAERGVRAPGRSWERSIRSLSGLLLAKSGSEDGADPHPDEGAEATGSRAPDLTYCIRMARSFAEVADALSYAHQRGVIHRDLKPSNLMVDAASGRLRVLDFGLARLEGQDSLTASGDLIGTLLYMSPEQAATKRVEVDHRTDIYSFGATLYEALTFRPPFEGSDHRDLLSQILLSEPPPPRRLEPRIPRDLETIVLKCLEKDPADRYRTAEALAQDLRRFARGDPIEARPLSPLEALGRRIRRRKAAVAGVVAFLLLLVTGGLLLKGHLDARRASRDARYRDAVLEAMVLLEYGQSTPPRRLETIRPGLGEPLGGVAFAMETDAEGAAGFDPTAEALRALRDANALLPERPEAVYHMARALYHSGRREEALAAVRPLAARQGAPFAPAAIWYAAYGSKDDFSSARAPAAGGWERAYLDAQLAAKERRFEDAEEAWSRFLDRVFDAGDPYLGAALEGHLGRGIARLELERFEEALEDFSAAQVLQPGSLEPLLLIGGSDRRKGKRRDRAKGKRLRLSCPLHRSAGDAGRKACSRWNTLSRFNG